MPTKRTASPITVADPADAFGSAMGGIPLGIGLALTLLVSWLAGLLGGPLHGIRRPVRWFTLYGPALTRP